MDSRPRSRSTCRRSTCPTGPRPTSTSAASWPRPSRGRLPGHRVAWQQFDLPERQADPSGRSARVATPRCEVVVDGSVGDGRRRRRALGPRPRPPSSASPLAWPRAAGRAGRGQPVAGTHRERRAPSRRRDRLRRRCSRGSPSASTGSRSSAVSARARAPGRRVGPRHPAPPAAAPGSGDTVDHRQQVRVRPDGSSCSTRSSHCPTSLDDLPRIGSRFEVIGALDRLEWYGRGPRETYVDRETAEQLGRWSSSVADQYVPYVLPQEHGNHTDTRWFSLTDADGTRPARVGHQPARPVRLHGPLPPRRRPLRGDHDRRAPDQRHRRGPRRRAPARPRHRRLRPRHPAARTRSPAAPPAGPRPSARSAAATTSPHALATHHPVLNERGRGVTGRSARSWRQRSAAILPLMATRGSPPPGWLLPPQR